MIWPQKQQDNARTVETTTQNIKPRHKRGLMSSQHEGHMHFPSAEGALMTISFLTFAVFLIKLVLVTYSSRHICLYILKCQRVIICH